MKNSQIIHFLKTRFNNLWAIYLFGSQVKGQVNNESDVDLAILGPIAFNHSQIWEARSELELLIKQDVDLLDLRAIGLTTRQVILDEALRLYCQLPLEVNLFETATFRDYLSFFEERQPLFEAAKKRGHFYGR